jgi:hypothetical protein
MTPDLSTANTWLGIIAISSVLQMAGIVVVCLGFFLLSRRLVHLTRTLEEQQLAPAAQQVHAILDDVKDVTSTIKTQADRVETMARWAASAIRRCGGDV